MPQRHDKKPSWSDEQLGVMLGALTDLNDTLAQLTRGEKTRNASRIIGAEGRQAPAGQSGKISVSTGRLSGWSLRETTGSDAAIVRLRDGVDPSGDILATIAIDKSESVTASLNPGIAFVFGCYLEAVTGSVEGAIYLGTTL